jgi:murein L,D-transpeptidase YcbB/YkuD
MMESGEPVDHDAITGFILIQVVPAKLPDFGAESIMKFSLRVSLLVAAALTVPGVLHAQQSAPKDLLPSATQVKQKTIPSEPVDPADDVAVSGPMAIPQSVAEAFSEEIVQEVPSLTQPWSIANARTLVTIIEGIGAEGLDPADYNLAALRAGVKAGASPELDEIASESFAFLVEDLRDGRTPMDARTQWFVFDPDADRYPTSALMGDALASGDLAGTLARITPEHPDYARLKEELAKTPAASKKRRQMIRANMDRWRWLARDMGSQYLLTNVPEYMLRLTVNNKVITSYRTVVGKPGRTATPQLAETVEGVIFNPTWTVPQSIVKGEGLGAQLLGNPARAARQGYKVTNGADGFVTVVQQPGKGNSLGLMKLDMPNPHAIFVHDTPAKALFAAPNRAFSHGCIRAERASELGMLMAMLGGGLTREEGVAHTLSGVYTKVPMTKTFPIYITYFTMARDVSGEMRKFTDIYGRDAPVLAAFSKPRTLHTDQRTTSEEVVEIVDDLS